MNLFFTISFFSILIFSCSTNESRINKANTTETDRDTCLNAPPQKLGEPLYAGFRLNMNQKQVSLHLDSLIKNKEINGSDTTVSMFLPYMIEKPIEVKMYVSIGFRNCYLKSIFLMGWVKDAINISSIDKLMVKKYGKGIKEGYTELIKDNNEVISTIDGYESALAQLKVGESIVAYRNKKNDEVSGKRIWNVNGVQIELKYRQDIGLIKINYESLNEIKLEKNKKNKEEAIRDSINQSKINNSAKHF